MASTRFPGKVLKLISDEVRVIDLLYRRIQCSKYFSPGNMIFLTTKSRSDDSLVRYFEKRNWNYLRGDENNVFLRFYEACEQLKPTFFFRICADNPFIEPLFLDELANFILKVPQYDYVSFSDSCRHPVIKTHYGFFGEIISANTFRELRAEDLDKSTLEHVTSIFYNNPDRFRIKLIPIPQQLSNNRIRLTIDTPEDLEIVRKIFANLKPNFHIYDVYEYLQKEKGLLNSMEKQIERNRK